MLSKALYLLVWLLAAGTLQAADLQGVWKPELYRLKDGSELQVDGHIFFGQKEWTVLFFVLEDGQIRRGSAEGGTYTLQGEDLVFTHLYHLSSAQAVKSLPQSPLRMEIQKASQASREACTVRLQANRLTLHFPSGNSMHFSRLEAR